MLQQLREKAIFHRGLDLGGEIYAIFFDPGLISRNSLLESFRKKERSLERRKTLKSFLPNGLQNIIRTFSKRLTGAQNDNVS